MAKVVDPDPEDLSQLTDFLRQNEQPVWPANDEIRRCFQRIAHSVDVDRDGSHVSRLTVSLNELFLLWCWNCSATSKCRWISR